MTSTISAEPIRHTPADQARATPGDLFDPCRDDERHHADCTALDTGPDDAWNPPRACACPCHVGADCPQCGGRLTFTAYGIEASWPVLGWRAEEEMWTVDTANERIGFDADGAEISCRADDCPSLGAPITFDDQRDTEAYEDTSEARRYQLMNARLGLTVLHETMITYGDEDRATVLGDLLGDLMHAAAAVGLNFHAALATAERHFQAETTASGHDEETGAPLDDNGHHIYDAAQPGQDPAEIYLLGSDAMPTTERTTP